MSSSCPDGDPFIHSNGMKITLYVQIVVSVLAILANIWFLIKDMKHVYFHRNIKAILLFGLGTNIAHSVISIGLQGTHVIMYSTAQTGCDVFVPIPFCITLRGSLTVVGVNDVPLGVAVVVERFVATIKLGTYEQIHNQFGTILGILATLFAVFMTLASQWNTPLEGKSAYCSAVNQFTAESITMWSYIQIGIEVLSIVAFFLIWLVNERARKRKVYDVRIAYQVHENLAAFKLMFPWMIFHLIVFISFNAANAVIPLIDVFNVDTMKRRIAYAAAYQIIPIYCVLSPLMLSWIVCRQKSNRQKTLNKMSITLPDGKAYEEYLRNQW